jgi:hypothetical protein
VNWKKERKKERKEKEKVKEKKVCPTTKNNFWRCGCYACPTCGQEKVMQHLATFRQLTKDLDVVYEILLQPTDKNTTHNRVTTITRSLTQRVSSSMRIRLKTGTLWVIVDRQIQGRHWQSQEMSVERAISRLFNLEKAPQSILRIDFCGEWAKSHSGHR